jgi:hypothetical protein
MNRSPLNDEPDDGSNAVELDSSERPEEADDHGNGEAEEDGDFGDDFDDFEEGGAGILTMVFKARNRLRLRLTNPLINPPFLFLLPAL